MPAEARMTRREVVAERDWQRRMNAIGAAAQPGKRSSRGSVFWSGAVRSWILCYRGSGGVVMEFYADCPCGT